MTTFLGPFLYLICLYLFFKLKYSWEYEFFKYKFIYFNQKLITLQYCIGFAMSILKATKEISEAYYI